MCKLGVSVIWNWVSYARGDTSAPDAAVDGWQRMARLEAAPLQSKCQKSGAPKNKAPNLDFFKSLRTHQPESLRLLANPALTEETAARMLPRSSAGSGRRPRR